MVHPRWSAAVLFLSIAGAPLMAAQSSDPLHLPLWSGPAPGTPADAGPERGDGHGRVLNVSVPGIDVYLPTAAAAAPATGRTCIVICSGGGYTQLAVAKVGRGMADAVGPRGIVVVSLKYRTKPPMADARTAAVADGRRALRVVRAHAAEWGVDPARIGMAGFSAGANLVLNLVATAEPARPPSDDPVDKLEAKPSFIALLATWPASQPLTAFTIDASTPPAFIASAEDDTTAPFAFSTGLRDAFTQAKVPVRFAPFPDGGHLAFNFGAGKHTAWPEAWLAWLAEQRLITL